MGRAMVGGSEPESMQDTSDLDTTGTGASGQGKQVFGFVGFMVYGRSIHGSCS